MLRSLLLSNIPVDTLCDEDFLVNKQDLAVVGLSW